MARLDPNQPRPSQERSVPARRTSPRQAPGLPLPPGPASPAAGEKTIHLATKCADEDEFIRRFHPFAGSEALAIPGAVPATEGTEGRFVITLRDQRPIMQGRCRIGAVETSADGLRSRVLLTLLDQDPRSRRVHERLLSRRRVMGMDVTPVPVSQPKKNVALKLGGAAAARETTQETRTPGSAYQLPANPLSHLQAADLAAFVECTLFEEATAAPPADDSSDTPEPLKALSPAPSEVAEKGRTKLFFTTGHPAEDETSGAVAEFDSLPTQPQEPALLESALSASKQDRDLDLPTPKRALMERLEDEPTTPGFDNPNSAIRHLFLHPQSETSPQSPAAPEPPRITAPAPAPPAAYVHAPLTPPAPIATSLAHLSEAPVWKSHALKLWAKVPFSAQAPLKKWGPTAAAAFAMFWLGFAVRGKPTPAVLPQPQAAQAIAAPSIAPNPAANLEDSSAAEPTSAHCTANIRSTPSGAGVKWGDTVLGRTPLLGVTVPCGPATVWVERLMFEAHQAETTAEVETAATLNVQLQRLKSRVDITTDPEGALVMVNKRRLGPAPQQIDLPRGLMAIVQVSQPGHRPFIKRVAPKEETLTLEAKLLPLKAKKLVKKLALKRAKKPAAPASKAK